MNVDKQYQNQVSGEVSPRRALADQAFSRAAGASLNEGNWVRLLKDATENYPAWLNAIAAAKHHIHFESYIIHEDEQGRKFADAIIAKASEGVRVRLIYDWMGGFGKTSKKFWNRLREGNVEVRCYNSPRLDSPLGWLSRDHRKMLSVDGKVGFITGLCIGQMWVGNTKRGIEPWRDTGIAVRGPAIADIERAFSQVWAMLGEPIPEEQLPRKENISYAGKVSLRVVATVPATAGMFRMGHLVAALARKRLWLTDAYYVGTTSYIQALLAAARDGVDVRLLVPGGTDIPILRPLSRAGFRPLLEAGARVFEWNGLMLHAKTGVADGRWARVGSTNLNIASWFGNCELDAVIEDDTFAHEMEEMYLQDLTNATEVVLDVARGVCTTGKVKRPSSVTTIGGGSGGRTIAGAARVGNAIGAAFTNRRILEPIESRIMGTVGVLLLVLAAIFVLLPGIVVYPLVVIFSWIAIALIYKSYRLHRRKVR